MGFYCFKAVIIDPYIKKKKAKKQEKAKEENSAKLAELKLQAHYCCQLMRETYYRIISQETAKFGLLITKAIYGNSNFIDEYKNSIDIPVDVELLDVTIPVQCLIREMFIELPPSSKVI